MRRLLLDTHTLLWWWKKSDRLSHDATEALTGTANHVFVSAVCGWEIATKVRKGQLPGVASHLPAFTDDVMRDGFRHLDVSARHAVHAGLLEGGHKDPFDRLIAAQALLEDMIVVTCDPAFAGFGCRTLW